MEMNRPVGLESLQKRTARAVAFYWKKRAEQVKKAKRDQGLRSAVTGGAQMDGFIDLFSELIINMGIPPQNLFKNKKVEIPGYFRPTKEWDLLVIRENKLIAAIEAKSHAGPSFGNNFNNRIEEATGSAIDLWTAFREKAFLDSPQPFLGYSLMLEDCSGSNSPVKVKEPHFKVFPEYVDASYARRYEIFCRKLMLERHYTATAFIMSSEDDGKRGEFRIPADDLSMERFIKCLLSHVSSFI